MMKLVRRGLDHSSLTDSDFVVVNRAILMNPGEVHDFTYMETKEAKKMLRGSWTLGGVVSGQKFADLRANLNNGQVINQISMTKSDLGAVYGVITTQFGDWQHRFVLPTFVGKAASLFAADSDKPLSLNFSSAGDDIGYVFMKAVFPPRDYPVVLASSQGMQVPQIAQYISEMSSVVMDLLHPSAVPSMSITDEVRDVEVSFLMPWACELDPYLQEEELEETT